jgi:hypothetical protein
MDTAVGGMHSAHYCFAFDHKHTIGYARWVIHGLHHHAAIAATVIAMHQRFAYTTAALSSLLQLLCSCCNLLPLLRLAATAAAATAATTALIAVAKRLATSAGAAIVMCPIKQLSCSAL